MIYCGDSLTILRTLPDESVNCCVTSPPYWGLRDYGVPGQLGLERTPEDYVAKMVEVFREVRRVLAKDGTLWLNLGDCYHNGDKGGYAKDRVKALDSLQRSNLGANFIGAPSRMPHPALKPKDLVGIPWRVAFALQVDGWWLRQDIIWAKPNPMPESVRDRCTKSHEYVFLLAKGQWTTRVVQLADLNDEIIHLRKDGRLCPANTGAGAISIGLASAIFDAAQFENDFSLPPFYSEVWEQGKYGGNGYLIGGVPIEHRATILAARFLNSGGSAKQFLGEIHREIAVLPDGDNLLKRWVPSVFAAPPSVYRYGDGTIAVNHSGQICKFDLSHGTIIAQSSVECKYYYDAEAIKEPGVLRFDNRPFGTAGGNRHGDEGRIYSPAKIAHDMTGSGYRAPGQSPQKGNRKTDKQRGHGRRHAGFNDRWDSMSHEEQCSMMRNLRSVWTIATHPYAEAHFATFPPEIPELCIKAGCPKGGTVLDPFFGAGTTGLVAMRLGREFIGIELNEKYCEMARTRIYGTLGAEARP